MCHWSQIIFTWTCALLECANPKYMQVIPTFYVSLAVAVFIDLLLDESCLRATLIHSPVTGRRLLEETRLGVSDFQGWLCSSPGARHNQPSSALCQNTLWLTSAQRFVLQRQRAVAEVIIHSLCCWWAWDPSGKAISEEIFELLYEG